MLHKHMKNPLLILVALCLLLACPQVGQTKEDPDLIKGYDLLQQKQYAEARKAFEVGLKKQPSDALVHFYLADACRGLKDWSCAEEHYQTSLDLDAKSSVAELARTRLNRAKVWRLLEEGRGALAQVPATRENQAKAKDMIEVAKKLGLDDEQQAVYEQLQGKHQAGTPAQAQKMPTVLVPAGEFTMGGDGGEFDEKPAHRVYLDAFSMDKYEVTVGMYAAFLKAIGAEAPPDWSTMNESQHQRRPVVNVDWADAATYCKWAGKRLPTEAEWEKAARGTDGRTYPWGNDSPTRLHATFGKSGWNDHAALAPVGTLADGKSPYGIYDMAGNVSEWVSDWYDYSYYENSPSQNPKGPESGESKVVRGGSWYDGPGHLRSALRGYLEPAFRDDNYGFRCAKTP